MEVSLSYLNNLFTKTPCSKSPHLDNDKNDRLSPSNKTIIFQPFHFTQTQITMSSGRGCEPHIIWSQMLKAFLDSTWEELWTVGVCFLLKSKKSLRLCLAISSGLLKTSDTQGFIPEYGGVKKEWGTEATVQSLSLLFSTTNPHPTPKYQNSSKLSIYLNFRDHLWPTCSCKVMSIRPQDNLCTWPLPQATEDRYCSVELALELMFWTHKLPAGSPNPYIPLAH